MELKRGLVVRARAGKEQGNWFVVIATDGRFADIADGKRRKIASPKRKNIKHIQATRNVLAIDGMTDKALYCALAPFREKASSIKGE